MIFGTSATSPLHSAPNISFVRFLENLEIISLRPLAIRKLWMLQLEYIHLYLMVGDDYQCLMAVYDASARHPPKTHLAVSARHLDYF